MKKKINFKALFVNLVLAVMFAAAISTVTGFDPWVTSGVLYAAGTGLQFVFPGMMPAGAALAGLNQEIWTDVLVQSFRATEEASFLHEIPDESRFVLDARRGNNQVIHLVDVGADPEVLINNTTYPVGIASQTDSDISITLDSYKTKATKVTDDEIQFIAYDKIRLVQEKHRNAIMRVKHAKAVHALGPATNATATPVLKTTGDDDGAGRKKVVLKDILTLKRAFDTAKIPADRRILVLCSDHYNDLLEDAIGKTAFSGQFADEVGGLLSGRLYGFKTYWYVEAPYYTVSTLAKISFDASPTATETQASIAFYAPDMFRASGLTKNYVDEPNTQTQEWLYNVRHNYVVLPRKQRAIAALISDLA